MSTTLLNPKSLINGLNELLCCSITSRTFLVLRICAWGPVNTDIVENGAGTSLATKSSNSAQNRPREMACYISGQTLAALISQAVPSLVKLFALCFAGIAPRPGATYIYRTFQSLRVLHQPLNRPLQRVGGSGEARHYKSLLLQNRLSSSLGKASLQVIKALDYNKFTK